MYQKLDVTVYEEWVSASKSFSDYTNGSCDLFFNNAGIANFAGAFEDIQIDEVHKIIDVNFKGVVNGCRSMLDLLKNTKNSMILNTSSVAGLVTTPGISVYGATKHAVSSLTESLRIEFERYGVRVSEINPWFTETPILDAKAVTGNMKSQLDRNTLYEKTTVYPVEKVVDTVWSAYSNNKIHNPIGFEAKFAASVTRIFPSFIRWLSKKSFKNTFI